LILVGLNFLSKHLLNLYFNGWAWKIFSGIKRLIDEDARMFEALKVLEEIDPSMQPFTSMLLEKRGTDQQ
jgi:hypothetical protein